MMGQREAETGKDEKNTGVYIAQIFKKHTQKESVGYQCCPKGACRTQPNR